MSVKPNTYEKKVDKLDFNKVKKNTFWFQMMTLSNWKDKPQTGNIVEIIYPIKDFYSEYIRNFRNSIMRKFLNKKKTKMWKWNLY